MEKKGQNEKYREIEKTSKEVKETSENTKRKVLNEINTMKVAVWEKMKTKDSNIKAKEELLQESDAFDKSSLAEKIHEKIKIHKVVKAAFDNDLLY